MTERTTTVAELTWRGELAFEAHAGGHALVIDGNAATGASPMQTLAMSVAGCMASDVVDILRKGRYELRSLSAAFDGVRATEPPRKFEEMRLHFTVDADAPRAAIERAIALSREKYCSVWHSMRESIQFDVTYDVTAQSPGS
jgi:putative redox protein